ncbi:MAG: DUF1028 domain-containing protein [Pseudomonadota bacterium]|jgi:uncharacterized Ntn-hydrolase superfamily protein
MTFSLVARCARTGKFGVAVASSSPAVAARCAHVRAGIGAVATQNVTDPRLGPKLLDRLAAGLSAPEALAAVLADEPHPAFRQLLVIDAEGRTAIHSGPRALGTWAEARGRDVASGGNLLAHAGIPAAIVAAFETAPGALGDRLLAAMKAGLTAGGEAGPIHSAGMLISGRESWPWADLRCDWTEGDPIAELGKAWTVFAPQADAYVIRALNPDAAPRYGVPGDE